MTAVTVPGRRRGRREARVLCNGKPIRLRGLQQVGWGFLAANIVILAAWGLYYLVTQVRYGPVYLKPGWDGLFWHTEHYLRFTSHGAVLASRRAPDAWWPVARHDVRDVLEGVGARLVVDTIVAPWRRLRATRQIGPVRTALTPLIIFAVALPVVVAGIWFLNFGAPFIWHHLAGTYHVTQPVHPTAWLSDYLSTFNWQPLLIGFIIGRFVKPLWMPAGARIHGYFVGRQVDKYRDALRGGATEAQAGRHRPRWPLPPGVRERWAVYVAENIPVPDEYRDGYLKIVVPLMTLAFLGLVVFGGIVKYDLSKH